MDSFSLSPECQHSSTGLCSKCTLNQSFAISRAEERHRRNMSNGSATLSPSPSNSSFTLSNAYVGPDEFVSFPKLPVQAIQPQTDEVYVPNCDEVEVPSDGQEQKPAEDVHVEDSDCLPTTCPLVEPPSLLMRLFESSHFSPAIAMKYLYSCTEKGAKQYLGKKLFSFHHSRVDFFIPQLINLYINDKEVASAIHNYIEERCKGSLHFALICVWLLESLGVDRLRIKDRDLAHGDILRRMILNEFKPPQPICSLKKWTSINDRPGCLANGSLLNPENLSSGLQLTRSESATTSLRFLSPATLSGDLSLNSDCHCFEDEDAVECTCEASGMDAQKGFVNWLVRIGNNLKEEPTKGEKTRRLVSELLVLNMHLPARVWIPLSEGHVVLNIPPTNSCVLNSKDKAPYCIFVEVLRCSDVKKVRLPKRPVAGEDYPQLPLHDYSSSSVASLDDALMKSADSSPGTPTTSDFQPTDDSMAEDVGIEAAESPWDTMSIESCASEPVMRGASGISYRLRQWVKRPGRRRQMRSYPDDPSASTMSEPWDEKKERIRQASPYGRLPNWDLLPVIVKSGDDLLQELLAYQLLVTLKEIWEEEDVPLYLRPYRIVVTSPDSGMIEPILDACSLHQIKRNQSALYREEGKTDEPSLEAHFVETFGPKGSSTYLQAQQNFVHSCAAYSLVCYFLQVKDRHNGNILIDAVGHLIHIDFGFILSISPKNLGFETSPFKLTSELISVMGGIDSDLYFYFKTLLLRGIIAARKHHERVMTVVQIMSKGSQLPCFRGGAAMLRALNGRFHMNYTDIELQKLVDTLVEQSRDSLTTRLYDNFQYYTNGIL
ncbi:unnamed protein product [Cylicocyclus nassatus]|uniref:Phosphatidylinositol 4-kinase beta n=1 Tax=Cylicocyclus nassatus TaxID=53992 RepID=A0AA36HHI8_CYLNA|nr:unnamed protein product [Cylicocyclus nassatus]